MPFKQLRVRSLPAMQAELIEFEHSATGARHIHLACDQSELVFLVAFPTLPEVDDGRAHILEHLALCGSRRYPVRDPFFAMLRRSTAHFMNAMTYSDRTVYPFATTDRTDFFNLLNVYLDAAFFPRLDYLDFLQEGWRYAFEGERLTYQGVVFNEMKGAFSSPQRAVDGGISAALFAGTTYAAESGGDPLHIPELTHEALKAFHAAHYHPSQAVFMTAGNVNPAEVQEIIEARVMADAPVRDAYKLPELASGWEAPRQTTIRVPGHEHAVQLAWLMGASADPMDYYRAQLLEDGLLGSAAAPLIHAMESAGYGRPSQMNGADPSRRQIVFHLGMEGLTEKQTTKARTLMWNALSRTAEDGVPHSVLQAALRDQRFELRDVRDGHTPYTLSRLLQALPQVFYGGDVIDGLQADGALARLQQECEDPNFFKGMVQQLLNAPTRLDAVIEPDAAYFSARAQIEEERLRAVEAALTDADRERIKAESQALQERQRQPVDNSVLPRIRPADVEAAPRPLTPLPAREGAVLAAQIASNGVSSARVLFDVSHFEEESWPWLQLYVDVLPEVGLGELSYDAADAWRNEAVPRFNIDLMLLPRHDDPEAARMYVDFSARGLREEQASIAELLSRSINAPRFDEHARLAYLIDSCMQDTRSALADEGDQYARYAASAPLARTARFDEAVSGSRSLAFFAKLHAQAQTAQGLAEIAKQLGAIHQRVLACETQILSAGMDNDAKALAQAISLPTRPEQAQEDASQFAAQQASTPAALALHASAQVNHCYAAWQVPGYAHADAPALAVLAELITNLVLHQALREEGGAYGGQAAYSPNVGTFVMMSYRDPRLTETYADFEAAIEKVIAHAPTQENLEEAIICVIQSLDRPRPPLAEFMRAWSIDQQGITEAMRARFRKGVLQCTWVAVKDVAAHYLRGQAASRAAFVGEAQTELGNLQKVDLAALLTA